MQNTETAEQPKPPRPRGGRPKKPPTEVRGLSLGVRMTEAEAATIRDKAEKMGMSAGDFLRHCALTRKLPSPPVAPVNREAYINLSRLAGNINQLARGVNEGKMVVGQDDLLREVWDECRKLRLALLGAS